jgi:Flp pilus assembly pilin Flp
MELTLKQCWKNIRGQGLIEYALAAGFFVVAAGAVVPGFASSISTIFSHVKVMITGPTLQIGSTH